jgi:hypothetical protein
MQSWEDLNMTSTETTLNLTPSTLSMAVLVTTADAVYLRLPRELQRPTGGCECEHCRKNPELAMWDTLVVPTTGEARFYREWHSYTCHMPDGAVAGFVAYVARKAKEARGQ